MGLGIYIVTIIIALFIGRPIYRYYQRTKLKKHPNQLLLEEIKGEESVELIGLTGGEPFINPQIIEILSIILKDGHEVLVLTNAYRVLERHKKSLLELKNIYGDKLHLRVSLDHYTREVHELERGEKTFERTIESIGRLHKEGFQLSIAGRSLMAENPEVAAGGYQFLLGYRGLAHSQKGD